MEMEYKSIVLIILIYLLVQVMGLLIAQELLEKIEAEIIPPAVENPHSPYSSALLFIYILSATVILLILLKFKLDFLIRILMLFAILSGLSITFTIFLGSAGILAAILFLIIGILNKENAFVMNLLLLFTLPGIGGYLGASLSFIPSLILLLGLSLYDVIAVFGTKHMVTLAKGMKEIPVMFTIPFKGRILGLGTGDLTIPLIFSVSVLRDFTVLNAILTSLGGLTGLILLFIYMQNKKETSLPALPPIALGLILGFCSGIFLL